MTIARLKSLNNYKMNRLFIWLIISLLNIPLIAQTYENKAIVTIGSGILEGGNYKSIVSLGEPGGPADVVEETIYSVTSGFIYVSEKPLKEVLGLKLELKEVKLYPNPTVSELHLDYKIDQKVDNLTVRVITLDGKSVIDEQIPSNAGDHHLVLDIHHLDQSIYIFSVQSPDDRFKVNMRFIKK